MAEKIKMVVCKLALRPRIDGNKVFIEAGTPFPETYVVEGARKKWLNQGILTYTGAEAPAFKNEGFKPPTLKKASRKAVARLADAENVEVEGEDEEG